MSNNLFCYFTTGLPKLFLIKIMKWQKQCLLILTVQTRVKAEISVHTYIKKSIGLMLCYMKSIL